MAGRFAPSPTGPLHLGSLLAATASFLEARARATPWRLRIDDIDAPRAMPNAEAEIMRALEQHQLHWDGAVEYQSQRLSQYEQALDELASQDRVFFCSCSRRQLRDAPIYPGTCRAVRTARVDTAIRVEVGEAAVDFVDLVQGPQHCLLASAVGDFIVRRRDGLIAYQLAAAVDDGSAEIDHVVRGADLLDTTPRQLYLMRLLGLQPPAYAHVPIITHSDGSKLSKQTHAAPVDGKHANRNLAHCLALLGHSVPKDVAQQSCSDLLEWALANWRLGAVPKIEAQTMPSNAI